MTLTLVTQLSDFILPEDIARMAQQSAGDIADGWATLENMCRFRQYPMDVAYNMVQAYVAEGLTEPEALRKVYHEVRRY